MIASSSQPDLNVRSKGLRALIVEDDRGERPYLGRQQCCRSHAIEIVRCIFMDVNLAGPMDGVETARLIRERSGVPIVFVTAYAGYDDIAVELEKIGASVVVGKPTMADAVESALRKMGLRP